MTLKQAYIQATIICVIFATAMIVLLQWQAEAPCNEFKEAHREVVVHNYPIAGCVFTLDKEKPFSWMPIEYYEYRKNRK